MPTLSLDTIPLILAVIAPGFVWARVHAFLQVSRRRPDERWLDFFVLSAVNFALWFWLITPLWAASVRAVSTGEAPGVWTMVGWFVVTFLSPLLMGIVTGFANRKGWLRGFITDALRISVPHPIDHAWDWAFTEAADDCAWATITLTDGTVVEGIFGPGSFASSDPSQRDVFLEYRFERSAADKLVPVDNSKGIWVAGDAVKAIEFKQLQRKEAK